jgi:hypothetical protein
MSLIKNLITTSLINEEDDPELLPPDIMSEVQKNIRDGAKDITQKWANALELVHKAYEVAAVERPTPDMRKAWKQYEENLTYAVKQLAKYRGVDGSWRMTAAMFNEALMTEGLQPKKKVFRVTYHGEDNGGGATVEADNIDDVIDRLKNDDHYEVEVKKVSGTEARLSFSRWGIRKNGHIEIRQVV